jgi:tripartite-type tricarboxylate transporter receptor subunit TctC
MFEYGRMKLRLRVVILAAGAALAPLSAVHGQNYPTKPIRIITSEPAGINDITTRMIAQGLASTFGQQMVVDNRGGAGGAIAGEIAARSVADGYTLISYGSSLWLAPFMRDKVSYDPIRDFVPITLAISSPAMLVVHPSIPANSVSEFIALAKSRPGTLNYGSGGPGTVPHLAMELFKSRAGINIVRIPYKAAGPAVSELIGGQLQTMLVSAGSVWTHVKSGKLKGLGVGSAKPSPLAPGMPTIAATGLPGYEFISMWGLLAPAKTPAAIVHRINKATVDYLKTPDARQRFLDAGIESVGSTPEQFGEAIRAEMKVLGKLITDLGIRGE